MFPAPPVNGYVVPGGWMPWKQLRLGCHPRGLFDRLKQLPSFDPRELSLDMELEAKAVDGCPEEEYADWVELHIRREQRWFEILRTCSKTESPTCRRGLRRCRQAAAPGLAVPRSGLRPSSPLRGSAR